MTLPAVVMAAGLGTRLRPITEEVAKPVLPIDGRPVLGRLLRELADAGCTAVTLVTGHLAEQVERLAGDGSAFGVRIRVVRQPSPDGSADAVRRAGLEPPYLAVAADTVFGAGDVGRFAAGFAKRSATAGAIAVRRHAGKVPTAVDAGLVTRVRAEGSEWSAAPLWGIRRPVHELLARDERPHELAWAFQAAIDAGDEVVAVPIGPTRDLTRPLDLLEQNFAYLRAIR
jgi:CTP:molybdopterin cytidylyltransferase MocA